MYFDGGSKTTKRLKYVLLQNTMYCVLSSNRKMCCNPGKLQQFPSTILEQQPFAVRIICEPNRLNEIGLHYYPAGCKYQIPSCARRRGQGHVVPRLSSPRTGL